MSSINTDTEAFAEGPASLHARDNSWVNRFARAELFLSKLGDHLNPILVKEARQALKSRQFTITFILVLAAGWCWSIIGIAWMGPGVYWAADGPSMFYGYFLILAFPLVVIVPYGAFRSLAAEREDRTYELLSITTLRPTQIIGGKMAGAVLQMMVYLSAISPCLAFTYLLRGLDILTIATIIVYLFFGSLGLSLICLLLATVGTEKYQQIVLSVGIVFGLGYALVGACVVAAWMLQWNIGFDRDEFWIVNGAMATAYVSYFALFFLTAASQLAFVGSNRSTPLRIATLVQQACFIAWMGGIWLLDPDEEVLMVAVVIVGLHWYVMGIFMTGEPSQLSPRVKRALPQSFLGRTFLTWFNPGPASGYLFALSNYFSVVVLVILAMVVREITHGSAFRSSVCLMSGLAAAYLAIYLGLGRIFLNAIGKFSQVTVATRVLIHILLLVVGTVVPLTIQLTLPHFRNEGYTMLQTTNPFWTLSEASSFSPPYELWPVSMLLGVLALVVFFLNLPAAVEEVRQVRIAAPSRVAEEDAEIAAAHSPQGSLKANPWDE